MHYKSIGKRNTDHPGKDGKATTWLWVGGTGFTGLKLKEEEGGGEKNERWRTINQRRENTKKKKKKSKGDKGRTWLILWFI
jgi:hypothetical protein